VSPPVPPDVAAALELELVLIVVPVVSSPQPAASTASERLTESPAAKRARTQFPLENPFFMLIEVSFSPAALALPGEG
jgi:hypothetical protein